MLYIMMCVKGLLDVSFLVASSLLLFVGLFSFFPAGEVEGGTSGIVRMTSSGRTGGKSSEKRLTKTEERRRRRRRKRNTQ